jgi:HEAT repeat protein
MRFVLAGVLGLGIIAVTAADAAEVSELIKGLSDKDADVRRASAKDLGEMGAEAKAAVPALKKAIRDKDLFVRRFAIEALGKIGEDARSTTTDVALAMKDEKKEVALAAAEALGRIGGPDAVKALAAAVKDTQKDPQVRKKAALALAAQGSNARSALSALTEVLNGKSNTKLKKGQKDLADNDVRPEVATAIGAIAKADDKDAIDALKGVAEGKQKNKVLQKAAGDALKQITGMEPKKKKKK